jgi:tRNA(fMet)-specific endonuclease VapC
LTIGSRSNQRTVLDFDLEAAKIFGELRNSLQRRGIPIGPYDTQIAAHALAAGLVLVTNNEREFRRVNGLKLENWAN